MSSYQVLLARIRLVRRRWRAQLLAKGISLFLVSTIALLVLGIWGADLFGFKPAAVWSMRILTGAASLFVAIRFVVLPLSRRISDVQVAQFVEERYPELQDRLVTAVEFGHGTRVSPGMLDLLIRDALDKCSRVDFSVFVDFRRLTAYGGVALLASLLLFALLSWGPSFFPYGFDKLYVKWTEASVNTPLLINVTPGNLDLAKGSDQQIKAQLVGFDSPDVGLFVQPETSTVWSPLAMQPEPRGSGFLYLLVDVESSLRYYVEAKGVRSQTYTLKVVDLPKVEQIDLTYRFPPYTGMSPQTVENEGDIAALKGTSVELGVRLTQTARSARLLFDDQSTLELEHSGGRSYTGSFTLQRSGSYVVQVMSEAGRRYAASSEHQIDVVEDALPKVTITKPFRDVRATNVEEVFSEIRAEDDIGIGKLDLHYSVNGGPEKVAALFDGKPSILPNVLSTHTFFLEEFGLQPGDVISYYGRASDTNRISGPGSSTSDIYFIEIRPFELKYSQNQSGPSQSGGGEAQESLSRQQKEIISATFKLIRDKERMDVKEYSDDLKSLALVQSRLTATAQGLIERLQRRGATDAGSQFAQLLEYLKAAVVEMEKAAVHLGEEKPKEALPEEQKALQQVMRAESLFREIQISFANSGGGGGSQGNAEDLADLFELELNKLKNQYETVQRGEQQNRDQQLDEAQQRLKELAQRQQQLNERNRMLGQRGSSTGSGGGGQSQEQLIEEAEKLQRQLQRLSRERSSPALSRVGSQLERAIQQMKDSLDRSQRGNSLEASAQGIRALQQLEDARRALSQNQDAGLSQGVEQAAEESRRLLEEQQRVQEGVERLTQEKPQAGTPEFQRRTADLSERKTLLAERVRNLEGRIEDLAKRARGTQRITSGKLNEAAGTIRDKKLPERILQGNQLLQSGYYDFVKGREDFIRGGLEDLNRQLEAAKNSIGQTTEGKLEDAANRTRMLAEGLESMQQRMQNSERGLGRQPGSRGRQSAQGRPGEATDPEGRSGQQDSSGGQPGQQADNAQGSAQGRGRQSSQNPEGSSGGSPTGDVRGLTGNATGPPAGIGPHADEVYRQFRSEVQQRMTDAQDLRRLFDRNSTHWQNLESVIDGLRRMDAARSYSDPEEVARLKQAIDLLRQVELDLNRDLARQLQKDKYYYSDDNEAPSNYRKLVEEYYKSLARTKP